MYELVQVGPQSYYIQCPAKSGVWTPDGLHAVLIDSGNDKEAGRKVRQVLDRQGWALQAILNTHSNADHIGGNKYLQAQTGCKIFANGAEVSFTRHPLLEPSFLYGGYPFAELRHKFLMAQDSDALDLHHPDFPARIEVIPLPGHFFDMVGFRTPDDTVFLADCLSSEATLDKYGVPFLFDVEAHLQTLHTVETMQAAMFVPAHADAAAEVAALAAYNRVKVLAVADFLLEVCRTPIPFEIALQQVFAHYGLTMNYEQYALVGSTIRSYLAWLKDTGRVSVLFAEHQMLWQTVSV
ncbi:MAG: MBL fold metallo-hydrolase [Candidatus Limiplasma sp.]|nr:MBL fold metallo-hydrolase [Candidatus Limiplasma sp.]